MKPSLQTMEVGKLLDYCVAGKLYGNWNRCTEDNVLFLKRQENNCVLMFLVGLDKDLDEAQLWPLGTLTREEVQTKFLGVITPSANDTHMKLVGSSKDLNSGKMIGSAKKSGGLYYLNIGSASQLP
ncbi:hypothetical protein KIW84_033125 [Lathyrus oleraceus]|uniref:Uncharacterized protein n=1 Tax=Pisum sativum TaxID=3888 RepID=A0A9D4XWS5_PEA|nr:hypothetical protein KIW84_033125 [Pisum sativum]